MELWRRVLDSIRKDKIVLDDLRMLVEQPSISARGEGITECAELLVDMLKREGFDVSLERMNEANPVILARLKGPSTGRTILLYNHYDVQPPDPIGEWVSEPFRLILRDGLLYGRGVADDKGDVVARLAALRVLRDTLGESPISVTWLIEGEEEVGSPNLEAFVTSHLSLLQADACLWEGGDMSDDGKPNFYLGVKGMLYLEVGIRTAAGDRHSMYAPILPNPAERLSRLIASMKDEKGRVLVRGFYDDVRKPSKREKRLLSKIRLDILDLKKALGAEKLMETSRVKALEKLVFSPTCNVAGLVSGYTGQGSKTIVPGYASVKLDLRLVPNQDPRRILRLVRQHLRRLGKYDLTVHSMCWPARTSPDSELVRTAVDSARMVYGVTPYIWPSMFGTGPMYLISRLGIPTAMINCVAHRRSNLHAPNENIMLEHLRLSAAHLAVFFNGFARGGSGRAS
jgi:acetylornithine deacetylase/succinyl-diaminopimelate desuccinylase-like protein